MLKRLISSIVLVCMLLSLLPTVSLAESKVIINENFDTYSGSGIPRSSGFSGSQKDGSIEASPSLGEWGNCMRITSTSGEAPFINVYPGTMPKEFTLSFNIMFSGGDGERVLYLRDSSDKLFNLLNTNGKDIYFLGEKAGTFTRIEYYSFKFEFDLQNKKCAFYLNNERLIEASLPDAMKSSLSGIKLSQLSNGTRSSIFVDNLLIYSGDAPSLAPFKAPQTMDAHVKEILDSSLAYYNGTNVLVKYAKRGQISENANVLSSVTDSGIALVPLRSLIEALDGSIEADMSGAKAKCLNKEIKFTFDSSEFVADGKQINMSYPLYVENGVSYISAKDMAQALGLYYFFEPRGLILFSKKDFSKDFAGDEDFVTELVRQVCYDRPSPEQILKDYASIGLGDTHPSLVVGPGGFEKMKWRIENFEDYRLGVESIRDNCDKIIKRAPIVHKRSDGRRLDNAQNMYKKYLTPCMIMYNLTGEEKYAEYVWENLEVLCSDKYPDWGQASAEHLNVAELSSVVSLAYDWLYHWLGEERREIVKNAIIEKGIKIGIQFHEEEKWWLKSVWNWNMSMCGGLSLASMAMMGEEPFLCSTLMSKNIESMEYCLSSFYPDGSWAEGLGYWSYVMLNLTHFASTCDILMGTDYGVFNTPGLALTPFMPSHYRGPAGNFNFHDTGTESHVGELGYFSQKLNNPGIMYQLQQNIRNEGFKWADVLWYAPEFVDSSNIDVPTDMYYANVDTMFMKQNLTGTSIYTGIHAGSNSVGHAHLDSGNFIIDANGERWIVDPGKDHLSYTIDKSKHWDVWALRTEAHNCIVINPDLSGGQIQESYSPIIEHRIKGKGAYAIADLTDAYAANIKSYKRGLMLTDNRRAVVVRDEIKSSVANDIRWSVTTIAPEITVSEDGRSVLLKKNKKGFYIKILEGDGRFELKDANPLSTSPNPDGQIPRNSFKQLEIWNRGVKNMNLSVAFIPLVGSETEPANIPEAIPLSKWSSAIPDGEIITPVLSDISLNGVTIDGFDKDTKDYIVRLEADDEIPEVTALGDNVNIEITYGGDYVYAATISVTSKEDKTMSSIYQVSFYRGANEIELDEEDKLKVKAITVSAEPQSANPAKSAIDGNLSTRWSAENEQWLMLELEEESDIRVVNIATYLGDQRSQLFDIEISADGENWTSVFKGASSGTSDDLIAYPFDVVRGKFVRVNCHGTDSGSWNSITEIEVYR